MLHTLGNIKPCAGTNSALPETVIMRCEKKLRMMLIIDKIWENCAMATEDFDETKSCISDGDIVWALIDRVFWWPAHVTEVSGKHVQVEFWSDGLSQTCNVGKTVQKFYLANCDEIKKRSLAHLKRRKKEYTVQFEKDFLKASQLVCRGTKRKYSGSSSDESHQNKPVRKGKEYSSVIQTSQELDSVSTEEVAEESEESFIFDVVIRGKSKETYSRAKSEQNISELSCTDEELRQCKDQCDVDSNAKVKLVSKESEGKCNQQNEEQHPLAELEQVPKGSKKKKTKRPHKFEHVDWDTSESELSELEVSSTQLPLKRSTRSRKALNYSEIDVSDDKQKSSDSDSEFICNSQVPASQPFLNLSGMVPNEFENDANCSTESIFPPPSPCVEKYQTPQKPNTTNERITDTSAGLFVPDALQEDRHSLLSKYSSALILRQTKEIEMDQIESSTSGSVHKTSSYFSMDTDRFEDDRVADINNPKIFFRRVLKNSHTKTGKLKTDDRVYNSLFACPFACKKLITNFSAHVLSQQHKEQKEAIELNDITDPKEKKTKFDLLRLKANHKHNKRVLEEGEGQILLSRRSSNMNSFDISLYGPCPMCFEWLSLSFIRRHIPTCPANDNRATRTVGEVTVCSKVLSGALSGVASKLLLKEVFPIMRADTVAVVAQSDPLIICLGNEWMDRNVGNKVNRKYYTSSVMRLAGRLKMALNGKSNDPRSLKSFISAGHFKDVCKATMKVAAQDDEDDEEIKAPSNAIKLRYDLIRLANIKLAESLMEGNEANAQDARDFLQLMNIKWSNSLARVALLNRKINLRKPLPLPDDVKKLAAYLQQEMTEFDCKEINFKNYSRAVILVLAKLISFNRRRSGEVQATLMTSYNARTQSVDEISEELIGEMTATERHILDTHDVIEVRGKNAKVVPIIVPPLCRKLLQFIQQHRGECGVRENSIYLFANKNAGVIRGYSALHSVVQEAGLQYPERIHSTNLRKYFATLTQSFDLSHQELNHVLDHLGHTLDVHKIHYRQLSPAIERVEIAKLLLIQDLGLMNKYSGKNLKDVDIQEILTTHRQNEIYLIEEETRGEDDSDLVPDCGDDIPLSVNEECLPDFQDMEMEVEYDQNITIGQPRKPTSFRGSQKSKRVYFTPLEEKELEELFAYELLEGKTPNEERIQRKLQEAKAKNGTLHKFTAKKIQKKLSWINNKSKWNKYDGAESSN